MSIVTWDQVASAIGEGGNNDESKTKILEAFLRNNEGWNELRTPVGLKINLTRQVVSTVEKIAIKGEGALKGSNQTKITAKNPGCNVWLQLGGKVENLSFKADPEYAPNGMLHIGGDPSNSSGNEDDTDGGATYCTFNVGGSNIGILYNGRNAKIRNNSFSDGTSATGIYLRYNGITGDPGESVDTEWRKNYIEDNQFHLSRSCVAVKLKGQYVCQDLKFTNNKADIGCQYLRVAGKGLRGLNFSQNEWIGVNKNYTNTEAVLEFAGQEIRGTIANNIFNSLGIGDGGRPKFYVRATSNNSVASLVYSGNNMDRVQNGQYAVKHSAADNPSSAANNVVNNDSSSRAGNKGFNWSVSGNAGGTA